MEHLVTFNENKLIFDTGMSESAFSKIKLDIREEGLAVKKDGTSWKTESWCFDQSVLTDEKIFLDRESFTGTTLRTFLEEKSEHCQQVIFELCAFIEYALENGIKVPQVGGEGIIFSADFSEIIFLPEKIFLLASQSAGSELFLSFHDVYVNRELSGYQFWKFFEANLSYRLITDEFPFCNPETRGVDIFDRNYRRLEHSLPGIDEDLVNFVDGILTASDYSQEFPAEKIRIQLEKEPPSQEEMEEFKNEIMRRLAFQKKQIESKRFIRMKATVIAVVCVIIVLASWFLRSYYINLQAKPTSKGLNSFEAVEMFYSAMNNMDTDSAMYSSTKGMTFKVNSISTVFVSTRTRAVYEPMYRSDTPVLWLKERNFEHCIYGLTQFTVDGVQARLNFKGPIKNTKPEPVVSESGNELKEGDKKYCTVHYFIVDTPGENDLRVNEVTEELELLYTKSAWKLNECSSKYNETVYVRTDFIKDASSLSIDELRKIYDFIPTDAELEDVGISE